MSLYIITRKALHILTYAQSRCPFALAQIGDTVCACPSESMGGTNMLFVLETGGGDGVGGGNTLRGNSTCEEMCDKYRNLSCVSCLLTGNNNYR